MKKFLAFFMPIFGAIYLSAYIRSAMLDVVYTDYIRIINTYLKDPFSPKPYFGKDVLTRLPITYFERMINVAFFKYSTMFDMALGVIFLSIMGIIIGIFMANKNLNLRYFIIVMMVVFSLSQWEMITNGTGWVHFFTFFLFVLHFYILDSYIHRETKVKFWLNIILQVFTILFAAGSYSLAYGVTLIITYVLYAILKKKKNAFTLVIPVILSLTAFMYSYANSYTEHAGATTESLTAVFGRNPVYFVLFGLNTFASDIISIGIVERYEIGIIITSIIGAAVVFFYIYESTAFPMLMLVSGLFSHAMVILTRWIFLNPLYAMSSRYALQFGAGLIGVILTFGYVKIHINREKQSMSPWAKVAVSLFVLFVFLGNISTAGNEIRMAKYRLESFELKMEVAKNFENESDETLKKVLQYHNPKKTREALGIIKSKKLNIFSE